MTLNVTPCNLIGCYQRTGTPNSLWAQQSHKANCNRCFQTLVTICQTARRHGKWIRLSIHRDISMVRVTLWLQLLLLVFILRQSDAVSDQCGELQNEISGLERNIVKRITELEQRNEILVSQYYVTGLQYDTVICSPMLCEWLLYCSCVVTSMQLYTANEDIIFALWQLWFMYCSCNIELHWLLSTYCACSLYGSHKQVGLILTDCRTLQCLKDKLISIWSRNWLFVQHFIKYGRKLLKYLHTRIWKAIFRMEYEKWSQCCPCP
jgi:hypothetical protein